jgi:hypothetical protein
MRYAALVVAGLAACDPEPRDEGIDACVERGVAYFREIGSYPTLSAPPNEGRSAEEVARERCERTTTAF